MSAGKVAADGSPVDLYKRLVRNDIVDLVKAAAPGVKSVLDLGSGAGNVSREWLTEASVTLVDSSKEMLALGTWGDRINCKIEDLRLRERFDLVLMLGCLVSLTGLDSRLLLKACARHVNQAGLIVVERFSADFLDDPFDSDIQSPSGIKQGITVVDRCSGDDGETQTQLKVTYTYPDGFSAEHTCWLRAYDDEKLFRDIAAVDLKFIGFLDAHECLMLLSPGRRV